METNSKEVSLLTLLLQDDGCYALGATPSALPCMLKPSAWLLAALSPPTQWVASLFACICIFDGLIFRG